MLGTVKMEGHESNDWNSYYADTQEVRGGKAVGRPQSRCPGRPRRGGLLPGLGRAGWGRLARGAASSVAPTRPLDQPAARWVLALATSGEFWETLGFENTGSGREALVFAR